MKIASYNPPPVAGGATNRTEYAYNLNRQPTLVTRPDGQTIGFEYDAMGRLVTLTIPSGEIAYVYDPASGNLIDIVAPDGGTLGCGYDGSLLTEVTWAGTITGSVEYGYDDDFRVTSLKVNGADPVAYQYDQDGLLTQAGDLTMAHDEQNGMLTGTTLGNVTDTYTYNAFGEVTDYAAKYNGSDLYRVHQELDKLGRITSRTETVLGETHTYDYGYDQAGRLVDVHKDGVLISHYEYDANGNRLAHTTPEGTVTGVYDDQDRILTYGDAIYEYTANGELLRKTDASGTTHYVYDVLGNLTGVTLPDGTRIDYVIDGQNRQIGKKVDGVLVQGFLYQDGLEPVAELDGNGNVVARFVYGSRANVPDYMVKGGVTYRIVSDRHGSVRLVVDAATGQVAQRVEYDEFGNVVQDTVPGFQPFGFVGGIYNWQTKFVRLGARDYNAEIGRWTTKEPIGFAEGYNFYSYCYNEPVNWVDINGLHPEWTKDLYIIPFFGFGATLCEGIYHVFWDDTECFSWSEWQGRMGSATLNTVLFGIYMHAMGFRGNEPVFGPTPTQNGSAGKPFDPNGPKTQIGVDPKTLTPGQDLSAIPEQTVRDAVRYAGDQALEVNPQGIVLDGNARLKDALASGRAVDVVITNQGTRR